MRVALNRENVKLEDIYISVTCPACGDTYNTQLKKPLTQKNCRCGGGRWHIFTVPVAGKSSLNVSMMFEWADTHLEPVEPNGYEVTEP